MISVLEQPPATVRKQRPDVPPAWGESACPSQTAIGARRNRATIPLLQAILARERDHCDMARLVSGDEQALDLLMQRHAKRLFAHLERIVKNRADAAELVQETFIRVFQHRLDYSSESRFTTWLYVIGSRLAIDLLRWRARHPEFSPLPEVVARCFDAGSDALVDPAPTPREQAERDEWTDALEEAFRRLHEQLREPLLLVSLDGRSQAEVAAQLGCTVKAVETRLYHGRKRLRAEMESILNPWPFRVQPMIRQVKRPNRLLCYKGYHVERRM